MIGANQRDFLQEQGVVGFRRDKESSRLEIFFDGFLRQPAHGAYRRVAAITRQVMTQATDDVKQPLGAKL